VSNNDADDELSFVVDQLKEITFKVGSRKCAMITQITELQKENEALTKQLEETKSQLLNHTHK
jgi:hypothetical protein